MNDTFAIIYAEHGSSLLGSLIERRSVSALPLAGRFRTIDVLLSNIAHSGIRNVGVITQTHYQSLIEHIGSGHAWDLSAKAGGVTLLPPFDLDGNVGKYHGVSDALFAKRDYINKRRERYCLLLNTDTVYREDYTRMLEHHVETGADITLLYSRDPRMAGDSPARMTYLQVSDEGWVTGLDYEAFGAEGRCAAVGAVLVRKDLLVRLVEDACAGGHYNFTTDLLEPALAKYKVAAVEHEGYVGRITTIKSYFDMTRDMLDPQVRDDLFHANGPVYTRVMDAPPVRFAGGCEVADSVFGNGCDIRGRVVGSVVFRGVSIAPGADVENCVVMQDSTVGEGAHLRNVIVDKDVIIGAGARIVGTPDAPAVIRKGSIVEAAK